MNGVKNCCYTNSKQKLCMRNAPGVLEICANDFLPVIMLMRDDLPTLDLPMTANSGYPAVGHCEIAVLLLTKSAVLTLVFVGGGKTISTAGSGLASSHSKGSSSTGAGPERSKADRGCSSVADCAEREKARLPPLN